MCTLFILKSTLLLGIQNCKYDDYIFNFLSAGWAEKTDVFILSCVYEFLELAGFCQAQQVGLLYKYNLRCYVIFLCQIVISEKRYIG